MLGSRCAVSKLDLVSLGPVGLWVGPFGFPWWVSEVLVEMVVASVVRSCCGIAQGVIGCAVLSGPSSYLPRRLSSCECRVSLPVRSTGNGCG